MHVLHRPHDLRRVALAALAAAVLTIVFMLAIADGLNDLNSAPTAAGAPGSNAAAHASAISLPASNPFTSPFTAPPRLPWDPAVP